MARDLEADLELCEAVSDGPHVCERFRDSNFIAAARTGWQETIQELMEARKRIAELELAIRKHRESYLSGDDKCWKDNEVLYQHLPEGYTPPTRDTTVELELCHQYIASCHDPRISYTSPQRRIEELEEENRLLAAKYQKRIADLEEMTSWLRNRDPQYLKANR